MMVEFFFKCILLLALLAVGIRIVWQSTANYRELSRLLKSHHDDCHFYAPWQLNYFLRQLMKEQWTYHMQGQLEEIFKLDCEKAGKDHAVLYTVRITYELVSESSVQRETTLLRFWRQFMGKTQQHKTGLGDWGAKDVSNWSIAICPWELSAKTCPKRLVQSNVVCFSSGGNMFVQNA